MAPLDPNTVPAPMPQGAGTTPSSAGFPPGVASAAVAPPRPSGVAGTAPGGGAQIISMAGLKAVPLAVLQENERRAAEQRQNQPMITSLAGHIQKAWTIHRDARRNSGVEQRMYENLRARRSEYDPLKLAQIQKTGGAEIYAGITANKCRAAAGWIRDVMLGTGAERPWGIRPTPVPELPDDAVQVVMKMASDQLKEAFLMTGQWPSHEQAVKLVSALKDQAQAALDEEARKRCERMADKMEDQLLEGGFLQALDQVVDDLVTFPTAILKGPVVRRKPRLKWGPGGKPIVKDELVLEWERVSPFDFYPSPDAASVDEAPLIQTHRLSRKDLTEMIGVEGYDEGAIRGVLETHGTGGLINWLFDHAERAHAEGKDSTSAYSNPDGLIDAIQYWGSVSGKMLIEWGAPGIEDPAREYEVEAWLIGRYVIKATLNADPLCRKPYYTASYENVPGNIWGQSVCDKVRDAQQVCNAAARALINNMGLASGPQVGILADRLAPGEDVTTLTPWRIWQFVSDPLGQGSQNKPIEFFQPDSNVVELMGVFTKFSELADEYSGIPRYMTGDTTGGAGRTASGLSMLISNAGKSIKQTISNIDGGIMAPALSKLYYYNMRYGDDPELKGDVQVVARGSAALIAKEAAQVRRNEFLAGTANPIDFGIMGAHGRAAVLREVARGLDMDVDKIVPSEVTIAKQMLQQQMQQAALAAPGGPQAQPKPEAGPSRSGQALEDGSPTTDNFGPPKGA